MRKSKKPEKLIFSATSAAAELGVTRRTFERWAQRAGVKPMVMTNRFTKVGGQVPQFYTLTDLETVRSNKEMK